VTIGDAIPCLQLCLALVFVTTILPPLPAPSEFTACGAATLDRLIFEGTLSLRAWNK